jgi:predicted flap endonuclease-1-like 5' DNA nuclease
MPTHDANDAQDESPFANMYLAEAPSGPETLEHIDLDDAHELKDDEFTLESEDSSELATLQLMPMPSVAPPRRSNVTPPPRAASTVPPARRERLHTPSAVFYTPSPAAVGDEAAQLATARAELARLARQMRARDAYLTELERALDASTRQLEAAGIGTIDDAARLLGKVRGQAFRIAELESELRSTAIALGKLRAAARAAGTGLRDDLKRIRGIGPRFAQQLSELGVGSFETIAKWTAADISHIAEQLRIRTERIDRDGWVEQARVLCEQQVVDSTPVVEPTT